MPSPIVIEAFPVARRRAWLPPRPLARDGQFALLFRCTGATTTTPYDMLPARTGRLDESSTAFILSGWWASVMG
jgi:hypothetical protein